jgi:hypothetical protein
MVSGRGARCLPVRGDGANGLAHLTLIALIKRCLGRRVAGPARNTNTNAR